MFCVLLGTLAVTFIPNLLHYDQNITMVLSKALIFDDYSIRNIFVL